LLRIRLVPDLESVDEPVRRRLSFPEIRRAPPGVSNFRTLRISLRARTRAAVLAEVDVREIVGRVFGFPDLREILPSRPI
jgi:hypothetical protein